MNSLTAHTRAYHSVEVHKFRHNRHYPWSPPEDRTMEKAASKEKMKLTMEWSKSEEFE